MIARAFYFVGILTVLAGGTPARAASDLLMWMDVDGTVYLENVTNAPLSFTGYGIISPDSGLNPTAWRSIADWTAGDQSAVIDTLGSTAVGFGELVASDSSIAEANPIGAAILQDQHPFEHVSIGRPFKDVLDFYHYTSTAYYTVPGSTDQLAIDFAVPEPSSWLLATLAAVGCAVIRRRRHGAHHAASGVQR